MASLDALIIHGSGRLVSFGKNVASIHVPTTTGLSGDVPIPKVGQTFTITVTGSTVPTITITAVKSAIKTGNAYDYHLETSDITANWPTGRTTGALIRFDDFVEATPPPSRKPLRLTIGQTSTLIANQFTAYGRNKKLTYTVTSTFTAAQATIAVSGGNAINITGHSAATGKVTVTASNGTESAHDTYDVSFRKAPTPPKLVHAFAPITLVEGQTESADIDAAHHFSDADVGDAFTIGVHIPAAAPFSVTQTQGLVFRIALDKTATPAPLGNWDITYTATDTDGLKATGKQSVTVTVNKPPSITKRLAPFTAPIGSAAVPYITIDASAHFSDVDSTALTYSAELDDIQFWNHAEIIAPASGDTLAMRIQRWTAHWRWYVSAWPVPADFPASQLIGVGTGNTPSGVTTLLIESTHLVDRPTTDNTLIPDFTGATVGGYEVESATIDWSDSSGITEAVLITLTLKTPTTGILHSGDGIDVDHVRIPLPADGQVRVKGLQFGTALLTIGAADAHAETAQSAIVTASQFPTWTTIDAQTLTAGDAVIVDLADYASDADTPDGDVLTYKIQSVPAGLRAILIGTRIVITGVVSRADSYTLTVSAEDSAGLEVDADISVTVNAALTQGARAALVSRERVNTLLRQHSVSVLYAAEDGTAYTLDVVVIPPSTKLMQVEVADSSYSQLDVGTTLVRISDIEMQKLSPQHRTNLAPAVLHSDAFGARAPSGLFTISGEVWKPRGVQRAVDAGNILHHSFMVTRVGALRTLPLPGAADGNGNGGDVTPPAPAVDAGDAWTLRRLFWQEASDFQNVKGLYIGKANLDNNPNWDLSDSVKALLTGSNIRIGDATGRRLIIHSSEVFAPVVMQNAVGADGVSRRAVYIHNTRVLTGFGQRLRNTVLYFDASDTSVTNAAGKDAVEDNPFPIDTPVSFWASYLDARNEADLAASRLDEIDAGIQNA